MRARRLTRIGCRCASLLADGLRLAADEAAGFMRIAQYGAVHTLEARVNEMMLALEI